MRTIASKSLHHRIRDVVSQIPRGRIATYGQVARLAGLAGQARLVGCAATSRFLSMATKAVARVINVI